MLRLFRTFGLHAPTVLLGFVALAACPLSAAELSGVPTKIHEIRSAKPEVIADALAVKIRGVVTRATDYELFIQDDTDSIFIWQPEGHPVFKRGDVVEVIGEIKTVYFTPLIKATRIDYLGRGMLPNPVRPSFHELASGRDDCHWVEVEGVIRVAEKTSSGGLELQLALDGALLRVVVEEPSAEAFPRLIGARIRLRGVAAGSVTSQHRMAEPVVRAEYTSDTFTVLEAGPADIFSVPLHTADSLLSYGSATLSEKLTRVKGVVTCWLPPALLFVRDGKHGLKIQVQHPVSLRPGDQVEVSGFPERAEIQPTLQNAFVRLDSRGPPPVPIVLAASDAMNFSHEANLVEISGELRELSRRTDQIVMVISADKVLFNAVLDAPTIAARLPVIGARVTVTGICHIDRLTPPDATQVVTPASFRLQLRSLDDVRVIAAPPWWTTRRLLIGLAMLGVLCFLALGWILSLNRRVDRQTRTILDEARKTAQLEERNRISRDFHDTLEQQLAGATILLDAIAKMFSVQPQRAKESLDTVRTMLRHSLSEAQQTVLDLRSDEMVSRDVPLLIERSVRSLVDPTGVAVEFQFEGAWPEMDIVVKTHLLRIVQESVTNALKHASPSRIVVSACAGPERIDLRVINDGHGFDPQSCPCDGTGNFGLIGMRERADKLRAVFAIDSTPERGTSVTVSLPRENCASRI